MIIPTSETLKEIQRLVESLDPAWLASGSVRAEWESAVDDNDAAMRKMYEKGTCSMLANFASDEFVAKVRDEFDRIAVS